MVFGLVVFVLSVFGLLIFGLVVFRLFVFGLLILGLVVFGLVVLELVVLGLAFGLLVFGLVALAIAGNAGWIAIVGIAAAITLEFWSSGTALAFVNIVALQCLLEHIHMFPSRESIPVGPSVNYLSSCVR